MEEEKKGNYIKKWMAGRLAETTFSSVKRMFGEYMYLLHDFKTG